MGPQEEEGSCREAGHMVPVLDSTGKAAHRGLHCEQHGHCRVQSPFAWGWVASLNYLACGHLGHFETPHDPRGSNMLNMHLVQANAAHDHLDKDMEGHARALQTC
ncbi:hypothetical protein RRF57_008785 [Xylaria bambusicola]|uniref:Uncharacterized protein n=1 Tax=Xylaria bambusicola TaxID=326684 RepID=A0AAN7UPY1_9PEZI